MTQAIDRWAAIFRHARSAPAGSPSIELTEADSAATLRKVEISGIDQQTVVVHLQSRGALCQDLSDADGIQSRCDYLLIQELTDGIHVVLIEMKSTTVDRARIERQFQASQCLISYCHELIRSFHGVDLPVHKRYVVFHRAPSIAKRPSKPQERPVSTPQAPEIIPYQGHVRLRRLR